MKSVSFGLIAVVLIFGVLFIPKIIKNISEKNVITSNRTVKPGYESLDYIKLDGVKRKVPEFVFLNQDSIYITNEDFLGKVYVAEFFFTRCPTICPIMNQNMKTIYDKFVERKDFGIASFTIDPDHDRPHILKKYSQMYFSNSSSWNFLTLDKESTYNLANEGFNIFASVNPKVVGGFEHQGYFALIDKKGYIRSRRDNFGNPIVYYNGIDKSNSYDGTENLIYDIEKLLNE
tara:strand:- start:1371 stop:2066 length:696 start_codon:yes stop_codon:yes gene_type:complete